MGMGSHVDVEVDSGPVQVVVVTPVPDIPATGTGLVWAPRWNGSRRTMSLVLAGRADRSTRSVTSLTVKPSPFGFVLAKRGVRRVRH